MIKNIYYHMVIAFAVLWLAACQEQGATSHSRPEQKVNVAHAINDQIDVWQTVTGRFQANATVDIRARVSGYLQEVRFQDGQSVEAGDVLFIIDKRPYLITLNRATAQYQLAKKELARAQELRRTQATSQQDVDNKLQALQFAEADLANARLNLEFTEVKSPIKGRVSRDRVNIGNLVAGGNENATILTTVVSLDPIDFYFEASEKDILNQFRTHKDTLNGYQDIPFEVKLLDETTYNHRGTINFIDNQLDNNTGTIEVRGTITNPSNVIQPGMFGQARVLIERAKSVIMIPDELIQSQQTLKFVYVVNEQNQVEQRAVSSGVLYKQKWRVIKDGLTVKDKIVVGGLLQIRPGMTINPVNVNLREVFK